MAVVHYNKMILYLCPAMLYYVASSFPNMMNQWKSYRRDSGVRILSITEIPCCPSTDGKAGTCIGLDLEATDECLRQYSPGQYVKICVPEISLMSYPFTINACGENRMRIIFRVTGPFTKAFSQRLLKSVETADLFPEEQPCAPTFLVDGFYGSQHRINQVLDHDAAIIIAGGIGITPYLSLLMNWRTIINGSEESSFQTRDVQLHWICRDTSLIEYVTKNYFDPLLKGMPLEGALNFCIVIHKTGCGASNSSPVTGSVNYIEGSTNTEKRYQNEGSILGMVRTSPVRSFGAPMKPASFCAGTKESVMANLPYFLTFSCIAWFGLWFILYAYYNIQSNDEVWSRAISVVVLLAIGVFASIIVDIPQIGNFSDHANRIRNTWRRTRLYSLDTNSSPEAFESFTSGGVTCGRSLPIIQPNASGVGNEKDKIPSSSYDLNESVQSIPPKACTHVLQSAGRPSAHMLLKSLDVAKQPAVFICGPKSLTKDVRDAALRRDEMRKQQCLDCISPSFYEEQFEL